MAHDWREIRISPRAERRFNAKEWTDALVIVTAGVLELESSHGARRRFGLGNTLFFSGLRLRALRNPGPVTTVLSAVTRRRYDRLASKRSMGESSKQPT